MRRAQTCEFRRTVVIGAPVEQVYAFHADPRNIARISPAWQSVEVREGGAATEGDEFVIHVRFFRWLSLRWRGVWRTVRAPDLLVDEALHSPFASWRHEHVFAAIDAQTTRLTDHVTYAFPAGWWGKIFGETVGRCQFAIMFADRHARTRRWLESAAQREATKFPAGREPSA